MPETTLILSGDLEPSRRCCQWCGGEPALIHDLDGCWDTEECQRYDRASESTIRRRWEQ